MSQEIGLLKDKKSGLLLPFWRCGHCNTDRVWFDLKGKRRCWNCEPPQRIKAIMMKEKQQRKLREQAQVDDFLDEDEDIQMYNFKHFGVKTS